MPDLDDRFFVSPRLVAALIALTGWGLGFASEFAGVPGLTLYSIVLTVLGVSALWVSRRHLLVGRWFTLFVAVAAVHAGTHGLGVPGFLVLAPVVVVLAYGMVSRGAAFLVAGLGVLLPIFLPVTGGHVRDVGMLAFTAGAGWLAILACQPLYQRNRWMSKHIEQTQQALAAARDDKSELHERMAELAHANRQLALASERIAALRLIAEEAEKAKSVFVAKVSHEFRTPLNMILGLVSLITETPEIYDVALPRELREDLRIVHRNCEHLARMVNDVLSLTQIEAGRLVLHQEWVDLADVVVDAVESVRPLLDKKGLSARIEVPDGLRQVRCDRTRIQQVILNLVSNAARFTSEGGIVVRVADNSLSVLVSVSDTGPGIAAEDLERIFEPFCQGSDEPWRDKGGSGLGLSISRQLVQLHGGRMWVESELGTGTLFTFELPAGPLAGHTARPGYQIRPDWLWREGAFRTDRAAASGEWSKPRVVVSDEVGSLESLLGRYASEVEVVAGLSTDDVARELRQCPAHAVIVNAATPEEAWARASVMRAVASDTPIVACAVPRKVEVARQASAVGYLTKPVTADALAEAIAGVGRPIRRVLVVDDDPDALLLFIRMVHRCDSTIAVSTAASGEEALAEIAGSRPDLVLLDVRLPGINGWQVLERLRQDSGVAMPAVLLLSAQDAPDQPPESPMLLLTVGRGLSSRQLLRCSVAMSEILLSAGGTLRPEPPRSDEAGPVLRDGGRHPEPAQAPAL